MIGFKKETIPVDKKLIDNIRALAIDMIDNAQSGHPGIALGTAAIVTTLYNNHLMINPQDDQWFNRDRFIMSCGHGSSLLYSTLYMAGYNLCLKDLKDFRKINSLTPGHPEYGVTPGVDMTTGPLGQGIASAVGIAIGEKYLESYFKDNIVNFYTYVLCGEGDIMEGVSYEACSLAGKLGLNKLIVLLDSNKITLDGSLDNSFSENIKMRFEAQGWNYLNVLDSENTCELDLALEKAKESTKPTIIEVNTIIGRYSINQGSSAVHGSPLAKEDIQTVKEKLNVRDVPFQPSAEAQESFQKSIMERCHSHYEAWLECVDKLDADKKKELTDLMDSKKKILLKDINYEFSSEMFEATRVASGKVLNAIANIYPFMIGGSADVSKSTNAKIVDTTNFSNSNPSGRNINFGIREHAMGSVANGLALVGLTPFVSTFFAFSDYLKPAIRMSALMNLPVIYVFTHDSISVGEDGPTHQPVEQLVGLRSIPNLDVYRPCDSNEVIGSYRSIFEFRRPAAIILGRNKVPISPNTNINLVSKGAYIIEKERKRLDAIIITSGEELALTNQIYQSLSTKGYDIRIVSMPSIEVFERQTAKYKNDLLPLKNKTFVIEASSSYSWYKYVPSEDHLFNINSFGKSGNCQDVLDAFGFNAKTISEKIEELLN